jgi:hypothetical protein
MSKKQDRKPNKNHVKREEKAAAVLVLKAEAERVMSINRVPKAVLQGSYQRANEFIAGIREARRRAERVLLKTRFRESAAQLLIDAQMMRNDHDRLTAE